MLVVFWLLLIPQLMIMKANWLVLAAVSDSELVAVIGAAWRLLVLLTT
jgi:hypothetical protein